MKVRQKVRSPAQSKGGWATVRRSLRMTLTGRNIRGLLVVLLAIYILIALVRWYFAVAYYGDVSVSDNRSDVHYALGPPGKGQENGSKWSYSIESGATLSVEFDGGDRIARITCLSPTAEPNSCPELYGRGIGDQEEDVRGRLGSPDAVTIRGDRKYMAYRGLGATFVLQRFIVTGLIREPQQGSFLGKSWKFVRSLVYLPGSIG